MTDAQQEGGDAVSDLGEDTRILSVGMYDETTTLNTLCHHKKKVNV